MVEEIQQPLETRISNEFKNWSKDSIKKLGVAIENIDQGEFIVAIEMRPGEEDETFRSKYREKFEVGVYKTMEEAANVTQKVITVLGL